MLSETGRTEVADKKVTTDINQADLTNRLFIRLAAKNRRFSKVDFRYTIFDACYLRDCVFDSCDFTGCRFLATSLHGSKFSGCKFDYAIFERTIVESDILDTECPGPDNLKMRFARTLRMNYQQLGDATAANKAINIELEASKVHKRKTWKSNESYYRKKYSGLKRIKAFGDWLSFMALDFIWGNGESALKLLRAMGLAILIISVIDVIGFRDPSRVDSYLHALVLAPQIFLGAVSPSNYSGLYITSIIFVRLIGFGFLISIIIKRFNRR